jgi:hypothetical protein
VDQEEQPVRGELTPTRALGGQGVRRTVPAPKILLTKPENGVKDVDPNLMEISVAFDQHMSEGFSRTGGGPEYPGAASAPRAKLFGRDKRTCILPDKLKMFLYLFVPMFLSSAMERAAG